MGYRTDDWGVEIARRTVRPKVYARSFPRHGFRAAVSTSLYGRMAGVVMFKPDLRDPFSCAEGFMARLGSATPSTVSPLALQFHYWAIARYRRIYRPVPPDADITVPTWLKDTGWSKKVCDDLLRVARDIEVRLADMMSYKAFIKDEWYDVWKFFRAIMGRTKEAKVLMGPGIRAAERQVFCKGAFIKKIPMDKRREYLLERFTITNPDELAGAVEGDDAIFYHNGKLVEDDVKSLEAHFREMRRVREMFLISWLLQHHPTVLAIILILCYSGQWAQARALFNGFIDASRGSGDFQTSLGNGAENESACVFLCQYCKGRDITNEDWAAIGFDAKCFTADTMGELSFCGMTFSDLSPTLVRDPLPVLARLSWTPVNYCHSSPRILKQLFRLRGISLACEMGSCPILWVVAQRICHLTRNIRISERLLDNLCDYERQRARQDIERYGLRGPESLISPPDSAVREFFASRYDIPVSLQWYCEELLQEWDIEQPLHLPLDFPEEWRVHFDQYASASPEEYDDFGSDVLAIIKPPLLPARLVSCDPRAPRQMLRKKPKIAITMGF